MNEKKERILSVAVRLFSQKGYYATSIQEIAEQSGISKGAFYLHFSSKEELVLSILESYYNLIRKKMLYVDQREISPREKLIYQISIYFKEILQRKDLILMQLREQVLPINEEVKEFMIRIRGEIQQWYEDTIEEIYGERIQKYRADGAILLDGMINAYIKVLLVSTAEQFDYTQLASFIVRRLDDLMKGLEKGEEEPMASHLIKEDMFLSPCLFQKQIRGEVKSLLSVMYDLVETLQLPVEKREEATVTIQYLLKEIEKEEPQKVVFQGLLANLREIEELEEYRQRLAEKLDIKLL